MSLVLLVVALLVLGLVWFLTRSEPERRLPKPKPPEPKVAPPPPPAPTLLMVYDTVTETPEACEHVVWFSRCEGDVYEISINNITVNRGSGAELDVAHAKAYSSMALMTQEKIAFPLTVGVKVFRNGELFGTGACTVRGPGEPLPG
jgi:hypothetical protein